MREGAFLAGSVAAAVRSFSIAARCEAHGQPMFALSFEEIMGAGFTSHNAIAAKSLNERNVRTREMDACAGWAILHPFGARAA